MFKLFVILLFPKQIRTALQNPSGSLVLPALDELTNHGETISSCYYTP
jgi:hypothetical protein